MLNIERERGTQIYVTTYASLLDKPTLHTTIEKVKIVFLLCIFHDGYTHLKNKIRKNNKKTK